MHDLVSAVAPGDQHEAHHLTDSLRWLASTDDVFRRVKPATPDRHLVSYVVAIDSDDDSTLLVDHINAGLWLPPGGHVEPDEHPTATAAREAQEELGIEPVFADDSGRPSFISMTRTVGMDESHTDVSLWYLLVGHREMLLDIDRTEFTEARWWTPAELQAEDTARFDPHYRRFVAKMSQ